MTLAAAPSGPQIVTVFNDRGPPLFSIAADNSTVTYQRNVSVVGWATSADGEAWSYKGKLATPGGWAALLGDPTIATDPTDDSVVSIATLALSTAGWNTQFGSTVNAATSPMKLDAAPAQDSSVDSVPLPADAEVPPDGGKGGKVKLPPGLDASIHGKPVDAAGDSD